MNPFGKINRKFRNSSKSNESFLTQNSYKSKHFPPSTSDGYRSVIWITLRGSASPVVSLSVSCVWITEMFWWRWWGALPRWWWSSRWESTHFAANFPPIFDDISTWTELVHYQWLSPTIIWQNAQDERKKRMNNDSVFNLQNEFYFIFLFRVKIH